MSRDAMPVAQTTGRDMMRLNRRTLALASLTGGAAMTAAGAAPAQDRPAGAPPTAAAVQPAPVPVTQPADGVIMPPGYVRAMTQFAVIWAWPMVNQISRRAAITQAPAPGLNGGVVPVAPRGRIAMLVDYLRPDQSFIACPNQDVVYGLSYGSLDVEPVVIQVPDFGERFWVYACYDARTDQFGQLGRQYGTRPGFYLLVGPEWRGQVPPGITQVFRSATELANIVPRIFMDDTAEDRVAIRRVVNQVVCYPLAEFDGRMKTVDYAALPHFPTPPSDGSAETRWVLPARFVEQLGEVLRIVPPLPGEEAITANLRQLWNAAQRDPEVARLIVEEATRVDEETVRDFLWWRHNGVPAGNNWNRSVNNAQFGVDYYNRLATAKSNILENRPEETQYFYTDHDAGGGELRGTGSYAITFPPGQTPPVRGFWSVTLYNEHHLFHANPLNRFSLGTKNRTLQRAADGSLTLYAGATSPGGAREANWLPAPEGAFSLYIRAYWGEAPILDGSWQPPRIERLG
jgi:hypothetical protein